MNSTSIDFKEYFQASQILLRHGSRSDALKIVLRLWEDPEVFKIHQFKIFSALIELKCYDDPSDTLEFLLKMVHGESEHSDFWNQRSLSEQAAVMDWCGQLAYVIKDSYLALDLLTRSASLGRDTSMIWRILGELHGEVGELKLSVRYLQRSLELYRQLGLNLLSGGDFQLGQFSGEHPLKLTHKIEDYLTALLAVTRAAKNQKNYKQIRELVMEMIHQFPEENRLQKIRLMIESALVRQSLDQVQLSAQPLHLDK